MKRSLSYLLTAFTFTAGLMAAHAQDVPIPIIQDGALVENNADIVGEPWEPADGFLQQQGTNQFLWARPVIGPGDFRVTVELKLQERFNAEGRGGAPTLAINDMLQADGVNGSNFGFVGGNGELFAEGNFFANFINLGETPIPEDTLFTLEFIREGDTFRFVLDGEDVLSVPTPEEIGNPVFRSGFFRVGLRPWRSRMLVQSFTINSGAATFEPIENRVEFITGGTRQNAVEVGEPWIESGGYLENFDPGNFIFGERPIFGSDFRVFARLQMEDFAGSAASFNINGDSDFGFSGGNETLFAGGPFFANAPALDDPPPIEPNTDFEFEMISQDNKLRFLIDEQEFLAMDQPGEFVGFVGLRPWRSVMRIAEFFVEPLQEEVITPPETVRSLPEGQSGVFTPGQTLVGIRITATVPEGKSSNALITEILPEGWSASNLKVTNGSADFANGQIEWQLDNAQGTVELTYDLTAPAEPPSARAAFSGSVDTEGVDGQITGVSQLIQAVGPNEEVFIVQNGAMTEFAEVIGEPWSQVNGALERSGTGNFLLSTVAVADVNYEITADLTLFGLGETAATVNLRSVPEGIDSFFGFDGAGNQFFTSGTFFDPSGVTFFGTRTVEDGIPFIFKMVREGPEVNFLVENAVIVTASIDPNQAFRVGLRPWRSRMQVTKFVIRTSEETTIPNWSLY